MKRVVAHGLDKIFLEDFQAPDNLQPGEYLLENECSLISPGTEMMMVRRSTAENPFRPGYACAGKVCGTHPSQKARLGQRSVIMPPFAMIQEGHASHKWLSADTLVLKVPDNLSLQVALFARMVNIGLNPFHLSRHKKGTVLIHGLGLIGNITAQVGRNLGFKVIGSDPVAFRREAAKKVGIEEVITPDEFATMAELKENERPPVQLIIDTVVSEATIVPSTKLLRVGGDYCPVAPVVRPLGEGKSFMDKLWGKNLCFFTGWEYRMPMRIQDNPAYSVEQNFLTAFDWLRDGRIKTSELITEVISPEKFGATFQDMAAHPDKHLAIIVDWTRQSS
jgi:threonine dehydrogenase-like Zn-dependent dehydrogenase